MHPAEPFSCRRIFFVSKHDSTSFPLAPRGRRFPSRERISTLANVVIASLFVTSTFRMAGRITSLLDPSRIALHLQSTKRTAALNEIAKQLDGHPDVANFSAFYDELLARDRLDTTCLGNAVALPHARTEHVKKIVMAVGRADSGIPFDSNGEIVRLFFVLGTPKTKPGDYLAVVSALCKILKDPADRATFLNAQTPEAFIAAIAAAEAKLGL
jgi:mannitol/fructose-specific phosphotransferase system IIA component (Ntr-type)